MAACEEAAHRVYNMGDKASLETALGFYETAIGFDPAYPDAYLGYARTQAQLIAMGFVPSRGAWRAARLRLEEALRHGPESADVHAELAKGQFQFEWDTLSAQASIEKALRIAPKGHLPNELAARIALMRGNADQAVAYLRRALQAKPLMMITNGLYAYALGAIGDAKAAVQHADEMLRLDPNNADARGWSTWIHAMVGDPEKACGLAKQLHAQLPNSATFAAIYALSLAQAGPVATARRLIESMDDKDRYPVSCGAITSHAWRVLGNRAAAIRALQIAARNREYWLCYVLQHPAHADLRSEPKFRAVYRTVFGALPK